MYENAAVLTGQAWASAIAVLDQLDNRPVVNGAPLLGLADMVGRRTSGGHLLGAGERITPMEALRAYTYGSAYAAFRERDLGTLEIGKLADFAVLSADVTNEATLEDASVLATVVGGTLAYERGMTHARP